MMINDIEQEASMRAKHVLRFNNRIKGDDLGVLGLVLVLLCST